LRSTLGYKYFAPSRAWAKQSAILISGFYVLVAAGGSVACGDRDSIDPGGEGFEFVESKRNDKRALIVRGPHEYIFTEES
jgi:hypothetical protein